MATTDDFEDENGGEDDEGDKEAQTRFERVFHKDNLVGWEWFGKGTAVKNRGLAATGTGVVGFNLTLPARAAGPPLPCPLLHQMEERESYFVGRLPRVFAALKPWSNFRYAFSVFSVAALWAMDSVTPVRSAS